MSGGEELRDLLARLRAARGASLQVANERHRLRRAVRRKVRLELAKGPSTVPAVAAACGIPSNDVLWHVTALRKYGEVVEDGQEGNYPVYRLTGQAGTRAEDEEE